MTADIYLVQLSSTDKQNLSDYSFDYVDFFITELVNNLSNDYVTIHQHAKNAVTHMIYQDCIKVAAKVEEKYPYVKNFYISGICYVKEHVQNYYLLYSTSSNFKVSKTHYFRNKLELSLYELQHNGFTVEILTL